MGIIQTQETRLAAEICEELFVTNSPHIEMALAGVEIFCNGSGSHHQLRKLNDRLQLMIAATGKNGGAYIYSNLRGCDGTRLYFDGCSTVVVNGTVRAQASQFSLQDVEVVTAVVDLDEIKAHRNNIGSMQESSSIAQAQKMNNISGYKSSNTTASAAVSGNTGVGGGYDYRTGGGGGHCLLDGVIDLTHFSLRPPDVIISNGNGYGSGGNIPVPSTTTSSTSTSEISLHVRDSEETKHEYVYYATPGAFRQAQAQAQAVQAAHVHGQGTTGNSNGSGGVGSSPQSQSAHLPAQQSGLPPTRVQCRLLTSPPIAAIIHTPEEECGLGPACWLWDYLRRSGAKGYFLPLSGGADSASVATIVRIMCDLVIQAVAAGDETVTADLRRIDATLISEILLVASQMSCFDRGLSEGIRDSSDAAVSTVDSSSSSSSSTTVSIFRRARSSGYLNRQASGGQEDEQNFHTSDVHNIGLGMWTPVQGELKLLANRLCNTVLHTTYMATKNNHNNTKTYAANLALTYGSYHCFLQMDDIVNSVLSCLSAIKIGTTAVVNNIIRPRYKTEGGSDAEDLALQNIQARLRMVMSYLCASLLPWIRNGCSGGVGGGGSGGNGTGFLLVLGSGNVDEALRGYFTKYDCSSADINPIGGICKKDLKALLRWAEVTLECPTLGSILGAPPTAELRPLSRANSNTSTTTHVVASTRLTSMGGAGGAGIPTNTTVNNENNDNDSNNDALLVQTDEDDMGMSYDDLSIYGYLRKVRQCGPLSMFLKLCEQWRYLLSPREVADKVKHFFKYYGINRHKLTTLTPSYHAENYSPDDNRYDFRPFLYPIKWARSFANIDACVQDMNIAIASARASASASTNADGNGEL